MQYFCNMSHTKKTKKTTEKRYEDVRAEYRRLSDIKEFGVQKHSFDWIVAYVAQKFYYSVKTVENIIFNRV